MLGLLALLLSAPALARTTVDRISKGFDSVYLLRGPGGAVLVDAHYPGGEAWILDELEALGVAPGELRLILLTHGHPDHAGSAAALREATGAPIAVGAGDRAFIEQGPPPGAIAEVATDWRGRLLARVVPDDAPTFTPDLLVEDTLDLGAYGVEGEARVVGGHSPGSLVVVLPEGTLLTGDLVRGNMFLRSKPTRHFFHDDEAAAQAALGALLGPEVQEVCAAHDRCMSPRRVRRWLDRREGRSG